MFNKFLFDNNNAYILKKDAAEQTRQHARIHRRLSSTNGCLPPMVVFHQWLSSTEGHLSPKGVFHQRSSSTKGRLPPKVSSTIGVFHQRSSFIEGRLPPKVVFHQKSSSTKGRLPPKIVFHQRSSTITPWLIKGLLHQVTFGYKTVARRLIP